MDGQLHRRGDPPLCHPDRPYRARGMCRPCYDKWWIAQDPERRRVATERQARWREGNRERARAHGRAYMRKARFKLRGITEDQFLRMREQQDERCPICKDPLPDNPKHVHIDHNHSTGRVRGILCHWCNTGIGSFRDDPDRLVAAADYLRDTQ